jgi:hypothetical protein
MLRRRGHLERRVRIASGAGAVHLPPVTLKPLGLATLQVVARSGTRPISAEVYLDGKRLGETPLYKRKLAPGYHTVVARLEGYKVARRSIRLLAGRAASVVLELRKR